MKITAFLPLMNMKDLLDKGVKLGDANSTLDQALFLKNGIQI